MAQLEQLFTEDGPLAGASSSSRPGGGRGRRGKCRSLLRVPRKSGHFPTSPSCGSCSVDCRQAPLAWLHAGLGQHYSLPVYATTDVMVQTVLRQGYDVVVTPRKLWSLRSCSLSKVVDIPVVLLRLIPVVQFSLGKVVNVPVVRDVQVSQGQVGRSPLRSHSCSSLRNSSFSEVFGGRGAVVQTAQDTVWRCRSCNSSSRSSTSHPRCFVHGGRCPRCAVAAGRFAPGIWTLFRGPGSGSHLFGTCRLSSTKILIFLEMTSRKRVHIRRMLWLTVDTYNFLRQSTVAPGRNVHISYVPVDTLRSTLAGLLLVHDGLFGAEMQHFSDSVQLDVESQGGGTPEVRLPSVLPPEIGACALACKGEKVMSFHSV